jgi:sec-independent protein translocase protein TatA
MVLSPLQFGIPGGPELLVILFIAVLLFGANKIPKLARSTGEAMGEFQKGREEVEQELQEMRDEPTTDTSGALGGEPAVETDGTAAETDDAETEPAESGSETEAETETDEREDIDIDDAEAEETSNT